MWWLLSAAICAGCDAAPNTNARLVVSIDTDMALPEQVDTVHVQVLAAEAIVHDENYVVGTTNMIPSTLSLLPGHNPMQPVTVRVWGMRHGVARTFREILTTMPYDRAALLRMPLQWLCDGTAKPTVLTDTRGIALAGVTSSCDPGTTCLDGRCVPNLIDVNTLPNYMPEAVFGGSADPLQGSCFDTLACMTPGRIVEPDANCTIPKPAQGSPNVALRVTDNGICDETGSVCFVPLDQDSEGWQPTQTGDRIALPPAVCKKLQDRTVGGVYVSTACSTKVPGVPACGAWSSVPHDRAVVPASRSAVPPGPTLVTTLMPDARSGLPCCPLLMEAGKLYTCLCSGKQSATVFSIDPNQNGATRNVGYANPAAERQSANIAAAVQGSALYWGNDTKLARTPLASSAPTTMTMVPGSIYENTSLLVDANGSYALASGVDDPNGSPVRLLAIAHEDGMVRALDTGANRPVFQFDQDSGGVYLATDVDAKRTGGGFDRTSSVMRIDKASGQRTQMVPERQLTVVDPDRGGYVGVQLDADSHTLFALFESAPAADGSMSVQLHQVDLSDVSKPGQPVVAYETRISPMLTKLTLLGAVDGMAMILRTDNTGGATSSAQLFAAPGGARILASYAHDHPGDGLAKDAKRVYWLNGSGRLYALPRAALR